MGLRCHESSRSPVRRDEKPVPPRLPRPRSRRRTPLLRTATWVDFDFFGHQVSLHLGEPFATTNTGHVGEHLVPMPHLGLVLELTDWQALAARLRAAKTDFVLEPQVRFEGQPGEQWTMFFRDPSGNPIEVKGFRSLATVYDA
jgi:extradiol dioxygenase family protein